MYNPWVDCRNINICGLKYTTTTRNITRNAYIPKWCDKFFEKKHLLAAAEANGIKVFKSWTKPRLLRSLQTTVCALAISHGPVLAPCRASNFWRREARGASSGSPSSEDATRERQPAAAWGW
jgi:hypothetical protein